MTAGQGDVYLAGGVEFVSRYNAQAEAAHPEDQNEHLQGKNGDVDAYIAMGMTAENVATKYGVTLIMSATKAKELGLKPRARIVTAATWGNEPELLGVAPIGAIKKALDRAGMSIGDVDVYELNEAFAAQVIPIAEEVGFDYAKLDLHGGAIALGHPFGMTGVRIPSQVIAPGGATSARSMLVGSSGDAGPGA